MSKSWTKKEGAQQAEREKKGGRLKGPGLNAYRPLRPCCETGFSSIIFGCTSGWRTLRGDLFALCFPLGCGACGTIWHKKGWYDFHVSFFAAVCPAYRVHAQSEFLQ